jgi:hypothetical protein
MPGKVIRVFGAGVPPIGVPATVRPTKSVPAALVPNAPVLLSRLVVLSDWTAVAVTTPPSALTPWVVAELVVATPVEVVSDAVLVSTVPVLRTGVVTDATVSVFTTPVCEVQPSVTNAERLDCTTFATET